MLTSEVLIAAKARIDTPSKWAQGWFWYDADGEKMFGAAHERSRITSCCSSGAIELACDFNVIDSARAHEYLHRAMRRSVAVFNDTHTHAEVMVKFDKAIASAQQDEEASK